MNCDAPLSATDSRAWMVRYIWSVAVPAGALAYMGSLLLAKQLVPHPHAAPEDSAQFFTSVVPFLKPEPREQLEFVLAVLFVGTVLFATSVAGWHFRPLVDPGPSRLGRIWRAAVQTTLLGSVLWFLNGYVSAKKHIWSPLVDPVLRVDDFWQIGLAAALIGALLGSGLIGRLGRFACQPRPWALRISGVGTAWLLAAGLAVVTLLPGLYVERGTEAGPPLTYLMRYQMGEFAAIYNGHTPDVDFSPQYQRLMAFLLSPIFRWYSLTPAHFTVVMVVLNFLELMAGYGLLVCAARSSWAALAAFVFMIAAGGAISIMREHLGMNQAYTPFNYFAVHPMRSFGPWMTGVAIAWHLRNPSRKIPLTAAGFLALLTAVNNLDFGVPAFVAAGTVVVFSGELTLQGLRSAVSGRLSWFLIGVGLGILLWLGLVFGRTGELPHLREMIEFQWIFAHNGFFMLPAPKFGLHQLILLTFMAAFLQGMLRPREDRMLNGLLIFAAVSGLGSLAYYVGRSHPHVLRITGYSWGFALWLVLIATYKDSNASRSWVWVSRPALVALLIGLGYCTVQIGKLPNPEREFARLDKPRGELWPQLGKEIEIVKQHQKPGDKVMIYYPFAHLIAKFADVKNVFPYTDVDSVLIHSQLQRMIEACDRNGVRRIYGLYESYPEMGAAMAAAGFRIVEANASEDPSKPNFYVWERSQASQARRLGY